MTEPTVSQLCRKVQNDLSTLNDVLGATLALAQDIALPPFRIAQLVAAIADNQHAWCELNSIASGLELSGADHKL